MNLKLRHVEIVDFRRSEQTHYADFAVENPKLAHSFRSDDVVLFASASLRQLVFVWGFAEIAGERRVLRSLRLRLEGAIWSEKILRAYARQAGLEIGGIALLVDALAEYHARRVAALHKADRERQRVRRRETRTPSTARQQAA